MMVPKSGGVVAMAHAWYDDSIELGLEVAVAEATAVGQYEDVSSGAEERSQQLSLMQSGHLVKLCCVVDRRPTGAPQWS